MKKILICGDRYWNNFKIIDKVLANLPVDCMIIHGDCRGADKISGYLANKRGMAVFPYKADWYKHGKAAGPIRNQEMLDFFEPKMVIAFHSNIVNSKGTKDMLNRAHKCGLPFYLYNDKGEELTELLGVNKVIEMFIK